MRTIVLLFLLIFSLSFHPVSCSDPLKVLTHLHPQTAYGQLPNGLTYYVRSHKGSSPKASLRLVIKVGSLHEKENEQGIAHFVEHMLFRGTEHFKDWEIIRLLESYGSSFGADTNAQTGFDSTMYQLEIPLEHHQSLDEAIFILSEWAHRATLPKELIEKERKVILDELYRSHTSPQYLRSTQFLKAAFPLYSLRIPIGMEGLIQTCPPFIIQEFYKKWYRPDRMAIIVVGNVDTCNTVELIQKHFSPINTTSDVEENGTPNLPILSEISSPQATIYLNPQLETTEVFLYSRPSPLERKNGKSTKNTVLHSLLFHHAWGIFSSHLEKAIAAPGMTHLNAECDSVTIHNYSSQLICFSCLDGNLKNALKPISDLFHQLKKRGITQTELDDACHIYLHRLHDLAEEKKENQQFINLYIDHFLSEEATPPYTLEEELHAIRLTIQSISLNDLNYYLNQWLDPTRWNLFVSCPTAVIPHSEEQLLVEWTQMVIENDLENNELYPRRNQEPFLHPLSDDTPIILEEMLPDHVRKLTLANGARVILKPTRHENNEIRIEGVGKGSWYGAPVQEQMAALLSTLYFQESGLGHADAFLFKRFLLKNNIQFQISLMDEVGRKVSIKTTPGSIEPALHVLYTLFTQNHFKKEKWSGLVTKMLLIADSLEERIKNPHSENPRRAFYRFVHELNSCKNNGSVKEVAQRLQAAPFKTFLNEMDPQVLENLFHESFCNPQDFTYIIVGNFDPLTLIPLLQKYIGSIPMSNSTLEFPEDSPFTFPKQSIQKYFKKGNESLSETIMTFLMKPSENTDQRSYLFSLKSLSLILETRLMDRLRKEQGKTYGVNVSCFPPRYYGSGNHLIQIHFTSFPEDSEQMRQDINRTIHQLAHEPISQRELHSAKKLLQSHIKRMLETQGNRYELGKIRKHMMLNKPLQTTLSDLDAIDQVSIASIQVCAQENWTHPLSTQVTWLPENFEENNNADSASAEKEAAGF